MMKKTIVLIMISMFFASMSYSQETMFVIHTDYGDMKGILYDNTPGHRDNFIKLIKEKWFDGSTFHRVIENFMIQGGGKDGGTTDVGYKVPAEFYPDYFHKKGALAAARQADQVNPTKASSGSQFYIVQGNVIKESELESYGKRMGVEWTEEQIEAYTTIGGTPHLDFNYTVFGEITEGFDVIDKIAAVPVKNGSQPIEEVSMTIELIEE